MYFGAGFKGVGCFSLAEREINPFGAETAFEELRSNPKTASYFNDPVFVENLKKVAEDHHVLERSAKQVLFLQIHLVPCTVYVEIFMGNKFSWVPFTHEN